jgi:hypothetical protein
LGIVSKEKSTALLLQKELIVVQFMQIIALEKKVAVFLK